MSNKYVMKNENYGEKPNLKRTKNSNINLMFKKTKKMHLESSIRWSTHSQKCTRFYFTEPNRRHLLSFSTLFKPKQWKKNISKRLRRKFEKEMKRRKKTFATGVPCVVHFFDIFFSSHITESWCDPRFCVVVVCLCFDAHIKCYKQFIWNTTSFFPRRPRHSMWNPLIQSQIDDHKHFTVTMFNCILKMLEMKIIRGKENNKFHKMNGFITDSRWPMGRI